MPDSRLLLMKLKTFMGIKTWVDFNDAVDGQPGNTHMYKWVRRDPEKRIVPSSKYLLKMLDAALRMAGQREEAYVARIQALEGRLANRTAPCDICPLAGLRLPAAMTGYGKVT